MKKLLYSLSAVLILFTACKKGDDYLPPDFNYEIPNVPVTEDINLGAYYYHYSATDWSKKYSDTPVLGEYSALDAQVMSQHRQWADQGGINFFIFNWNGASAGDPLLNSFIGGRSEQVKMVINYNVAHLKATNASPLADAKLNTMIDEIKTLAAEHFDKDYYFKMNGQPVVIITALNLSSNAASSIDYPMVMSSLRSALTASGIDPYFIGEINSGWLPPQRYDVSVKAMDGVVLNNWSTNNYDRYIFFPSYSDMNWQNWKDSTTAWGSVDYIPCVFPGFNDKTMTPTSKNYDIERTEEFYTDYANVAKRNMSDNKLVFINSWNHFQWGTAIEPAIEYGETFLDLTRKQFKKP